MVTRATSHRPDVAAPDVAAPDVAAADGAVAGEVARVWAIAAAVPDPEMPVLTLADLGVLRRVELAPSGVVVVSITPTYTGCPAVEEMRADLRAALHRAGYRQVEVQVRMHPAWSTDWIGADGRRKLAAAGIAPPGPAPRRPAGPVPLTLVPAPHRVACPQCGSADTQERSRFGPTPCTALRRCNACGEPFEHVKEI